MHPLSVSSRLTAITILVCVKKTQNEIAPRTWMYILDVMFNTNYFHTAYDYFRRLYDESHENSWMLPLPGEVVPLYNRLVTLHTPIHPNIYIRHRSTLTNNYIESVGLDMTTHVMDVVEKQEWTSDMMWDVVAYDNSMYTNMTSMEIALKTFDGKCSDCCFPTSLLEFDADCDGAICRLKMGKCPMSHDIYDMVNYMNADGADSIEKATVYCDSLWIYIADGEYTHSFPTVGIIFNKDTDTTSLVNTMS